MTGGGSNPGSIWPCEATASMPSGRTGTRIPQADRRSRKPPRPGGTRNWILAGRAPRQRCHEAGFPAGAPRRRLRALARQGRRSASTSQRRRRSPIGMQKPAIGGRRLSGWLSVPGGLLVTGGKHENSEGSFEATRLSLSGRAILMLRLHWRHSSAAKEKPRSGVPVGPPSGPAQVLPWPADAWREPAVLSSRDLERDRSGLELTTHPSRRVPSRLVA
jgi:hypothetical protein